MAPPEYRVIYNWDGAPHGYGAPPQSMEDFLRACYAPLEGTHVSALFFSSGGHTSEYPSEVLPLRGEKGGRVYDSVGGLIHSENIQQRIADGEDWQRELITRGHALGIDVYASFRMNDNREYLGMCMYWVGAFQ